MTMEREVRLKTILQGAATSIWAGVVAVPEAVGGRYCEDCQVASLISDYPLEMADAGVRPYALDPQRAKALWARSEEMVGESF
jgi:hypothetical protein